MNAGPAIPIWFTAPLAMIVLLILAGHLTALRSAAHDLPVSRVRIRAVNNVVLMILTPMLVFAFSVATPGGPRVFALTWFVCIGLLFISLVLAGIDMVNSYRIARSARAELREELVRARSAIAEMQRERYAAQTMRPTSPDDEQPELRLTDKHEERNRDD